MFDGEFFYSDVYKRTIKLNPFEKTAIYEGVLNRENADNFIKDGYECVQFFDEDTAAEICRIINLQLESAYSWMSKFSKHNQ